MSSLDHLPDELLLEIVHCLNAIRSFETQSTAFKRKQIERERQRENCVRERALYSLCLTSHRMRALSTPTLYASSCTSATRTGLRQLELLHRTISAPDNALGQTKLLAKHILHVENRLADFRGNSLHDDEVFLQESFATYSRLLGDLVLKAPNVEHICVVSIDDSSNDVSFWDHLLSKPPHATQDGLAKLRFLSTQLHTSFDESESRQSSFERLIARVRSLPRFSTLQVSGATSNTWSLLTLRPSDLPRVYRLELTECALEMEEVASLLFACNNLQHFTCKWGHVVGMISGPSELHAALLAHTDTLETLFLDWREVVWQTVVFHHDALLLGSLQSMKLLRNLQLCEIGFLTDDLSEIPPDYPFQSAKRSLAGLLPASLECLTLYPVEAIECHIADLVHRAPLLWQFSGEIVKLLPLLKTVCIAMKPVNILCESLEREFESAGVELRIELET
jgi:hypothetical protein